MNAIIYIKNGLNEGFGPEALLVFPVVILAWSIAFAVFA